MGKINYKELTIDEIEKTLKKEKYKSRYIKLLLSTIYILIIVSAISAIIATLIMPVLKISGSSMTPTLKEGEIVVSIKTKNINKKDVVAFYYGNKILVKRIIASSGDWVNIDEDGNIYINDSLLNEPYITKKNIGTINIKLPYQVPEGTYFVLGDERESSIDSRNTKVGTIEENNIIGKVIFKIWPIKRIGKIKK